MQALQAPSWPMTSLTHFRVRPWVDSRHMNPADRMTPAHWTHTWNKLVIDQGSRVGVFRIEL
jgi:hypothetical protein